MENQSENKENETQEEISQSIMDIDEVYGTKC
jgi:hypothetical protein